MNKYRSWGQMFIGLLYILMAAYIAYNKSFGTIALSSTTAYVLAFILIAYGLFRVYRGIKDIEQSKNEEQQTRS